MYRLNANKPIVAGVEYTTNTPTKPPSWQTASPKIHLPVITTGETKGIFTVAHNTSLAAKAMMYRLVGDRSLVFLYIAKQTRTFPTILMTFIVRQILDSTTTAAKLLFGNSREGISALACYKIRPFCFVSAC